jgi:hypothetical protein
MMMTRRNILRQRKIRLSCISAEMSRRLAASNRRVHKFPSEEEVISTLQAQARGNAM